MSTGELRCLQYFFNSFLLREAKIWLSYISFGSALRNGWLPGPPLNVEMSFFCVGVHQKFKSFKSDSYEHGGEAFSLHYGSGHLLGIAGKDTLQVSVP